MGRYACFGGNFLYIIDKINENKPIILSNNNKRSNGVSDNKGKFHSYYWTKSIKSNLLLYKKQQFGKSELFKRCNIDNRSTSLNKPPHIYRLSNKQREPGK